MKSFKSIICFTVIGLVIARFIVFVVRQSYNVPYFDDYRTITILSRLVSEPGSWYKELFQDFNGHRFPGIFSLMWLDLLVEGSYNLRTMMFVGALAYIGLFFVMIKTIRMAGLSFVWAIPVALLMFQPSVQRDIFWPIATLQYMISALLTASILYLLCRNTKRTFIIATILSLWLPYTNGNGIYVLILGLAPLLLQRRYKFALIWAGVLALNATFFYTGMPTVIGLGGYSDQSEHLKNSFMKVVANFLSFVGSNAFEFRMNGMDTILAGLVVCFIVALAGIGYLWRSFKVQNSRIILRPMSKRNASFLTVLLIALSILLTAAGAAISRPSETNFKVVDRYLIYSVWGFACSFILLVFLIPANFKRALQVAGIVIGLVFNIYMYWYYTPMAQAWKQSLLTDAYMLKEFQTVQGKMFPFDVPVQREFREAVQKNVYRLPSEPLEKIRPQINLPIDSSEIDPSIQISSISTHISVYSGIDVVQYSFTNLGRFDGPRYMILKNTDDGKAYLTATHYIRTLGYKSFLGIIPEYSSVLSATYFSGTVPPGQYQIGILSIGEEVIQQFSKEKMTVSTNENMSLFLKNGAFTKLPLPQGKP